MRTPGGPFNPRSCGEVGLRFDPVRSRRMRGAAEHALLQARDLLANGHGIIDDRGLGYAPEMVLQVRLGPRARPAVARTILRVLARRPARQRTQVRERVRRDAARRLDDERNDAVELVELLYAYS